MAVTQRGTSYQVYVRDPSFPKGRIRESFKDKAKADARDAELMARKVAAAGPPVNAADFARPTLEAVFKAVRAGSWAGKRGERTAVKNAQDCIDSLKALHVAIEGKYDPDGARAVSRIDEVTTQVIDKLIERLRASGIVGATIKRKLAALSKMLRWAVDRDYIKAVPHIPRSGLGKDRERKRYMTPEEEADGLEHLESIGKQSFADYVRFAADTGLRLSEGMRLEWGHVAAEDGTENAVVFVWVNKTDNPRSVPTTHRVREILARRRAERPLHEKRVWWDLNVDACQYTWGLMRAELDLEDDEDFVIHCLRHTFASRLIQKRVDPVTVAELGGWKTMSMVKRYGHLNQASKRDAIRQMEGVSDVPENVMGVQRQGVA